MVRATQLTIDCVHSFFRELLPLLASIAAFVFTGIAGGTCHFVERDFYVTPLTTPPQDYFLYFGGCEKYFTVEECSQCYENPDSCELVFPPIVPEDYRKETQGIGFWNMERFTGYGSSSDPPAVREVSDRRPSCQKWPKDYVEDFDGFWLFGRIMSTMAIFLGILAVGVLLFLACARDMMVKPFLVVLHLAVGVFSVLLLIAIKSDLCSDSGLALVESESGGGFYEFPVAGCHAGTGQKVVLGSLCCSVLGAIGIMVVYKDPNEPSILEKWAKITAASARISTKQTNVTPSQEEEEKEEVTTSSGPMESTIVDTLGPMDGDDKV
jgi:hypothetical protein